MSPYEDALKVVMVLHGITKSKIPSFGRVLRGRLVPSPSTSKLLSNEVFHLAWMRYVISAPINLSPGDNDSRKEVLAFAAFALAAVTCRNGYMYNRGAATPYQGGKEKGLKGSSDWEIQTRDHWPN